MLVDKASFAATPLKVQPDVDKHGTVDKSMDVVYHQIVMAKSV